jgi:hypothetical protein
MLLLLLFVVAVFFLQFPCVVVFPRDSPSSRGAATMRSESLGPRYAPDTPVAELVKNIVQNQLKLNIDYAPIVKQLQVRYGIVVVAVVVVVVVGIFFCYSLRILTA